MILKKRVHGYTVMELVVVLSILVILVSISALGVKRLLEEAKKSVCMTELRLLQETYTIANQESMKSFEEILISTGAQCPSGGYYDLLEEHQVFCSIHSEIESEEVPYLKR